MRSIQTGRRLFVGNSPEARPILANRCETYQSILAVSVTLRMTLNFATTANAKPKGGDRQLAKGSIRKRSDVYYCIYRVGNRQKWEVGGRTKKEAERLLAKRLHELNTGNLPEETKLLFRDFAATWLDDYAKVSVKQSTFESYRDLLRLHLLPAFGDLQLNRISSSQIQALLANKISKESLSPKTVVNILVPLKEMFKHAVLWGLIRHDPTLAVRRPRVEQEEMDFFTPEEITVFLQHVRSQYYAFFLTAVLTGMRRGELLALQWGDIDWHSSQVCVRRSLYKGQFVSPKSANSTRRIIMSPSLKRRLEDHRLLSPQTQLDLVYCTELGQALDPDNRVKREFHPALERAGLRRIRFHDLRHTFASLLIANGEDIKFIQNQLGHASAMTTLDRYGHLFPGGQKEAAERLDLAVFGNSVSKLLANVSKRGLPDIKKPSEVVTPQRVNLVAGAGFEPATFGL